MRKTLRYQIDLIARRIKLAARHLVYIVGNVLFAALFSDADFRSMSSVAQIALLIAPGSPFVLDGTLFSGSVSKIEDHGALPFVRAAIGRAQLRTAAMAPQPAGLPPCPVCRTGVADLALVDRPAGAEDATCCICSAAPADCVALPCCHGQFRDPRWCNLTRRRRLLLHGMPARLVLRARRNPRARHPAARPSLLRLAPSRRRIRDRPPAHPARRLLEHRSSCRTVNKRPVHSQSPSLTVLLSTNTTIRTVFADALVRPIGKKNTCGTDRDRRGTGQRRHSQRAKMGGAAGRRRAHESQSRIARASRRWRRSDATGRALQLQRCRKPPSCWRSSDNHFHPGRTSQSPSRRALTRAMKTSDKRRYRVGGRLNERNHVTT